MSRETISIPSIVVLVLCLLAPAACWADIVFMKDGKVYRGEVTRDGTKVLVKTSMSGVPVTISLDAADVDRIQKTEGSQAPTGGTTKAPPISLATGRTLKDMLTRPEPLVFLAMRKHAASASHEATQQIKEFQAKAHDGERKVAGRWLPTEELARGREKFFDIVKESRSTLSELRSAASGSLTERRQVPRHRRRLAVYYRKAADAWPDDLLGEFLLGAGQIEGLDYIGAGRTFQKCIQAAPRVAAFHQGRAMALAGRGKHLDALSAALKAVELQPDSMDAVMFLKARLAETPGDLLAEPRFAVAKAVLELYELPDRSSSGYRRGPIWLMPGRSVSTSEYCLPALPMDRLEFRQAVGVPVGKHGLLVDEAALDDAAEAFVEVAPGVAVPAQVTRTGGYYGFTGKTKTDVPVKLLTVKDVEFTALAPGDRAAKGSAVTFYSLPLFEKAGSEVRTVDATVRAADANGIPTLSSPLLAGETAAPVLTKKGALLGFLAGRTDHMAAGGGPDRFVPVDALASLIKRANQRSSFASYSRAKRKIHPKPARGQFFKVYVTATEEPMKTR